jgi:ABC transport system ATP-binding/permease protein
MKEAACQTGTGDRTPVLISLNPSLVHREYRLEVPVITIGRDAVSCEVVVSGDTVSRRHCRIVSQTGEHAIEDLNSTNGVFVNRERVTGKTVLRDGDLIGLGAPFPEHFRFQAAGGLRRAWTTVIPAKDSWSVGRSPGNDVALTYESTVSARHAVVRAKRGSLEIADQGSLNGTWLNGRRVRKAAVNPADTFTIGSSHLRMQLQSDGSLEVVRRDCGEEIALESVALTREVSTGGLGRGANKRLLDRVSLAIRPGEFVGVLGPSGAGKSTLLRALNGYTPPDRGCVLLNETPLYQCFDMFRNVIGYVPQDDIVHAELTVEDSLDYVARLRLPCDVDARERRDLIASTLETLGLSHVSTSRIKDLSGGQRKRVSIGCELITRPSILFLDEPTSGMDPSTEERLMLHFQAMARRGITVLITTHILYNLDLLDRIIILSRGRLVFFGEPREAMAFFTMDGKPIERPTAIFEALEEEPHGSDGGGDPQDATAQEYQRKYLLSGLYEKHVEGELSGVATQLLETCGPGVAGKQTDPASPPATSTTNAGYYAALLRRGGLGAGKGGISLDLFSPRHFLTLTRRQFAVKLVSLKRALLYLAVPLILALVTLSLPSAEIVDDVTMEADRISLSDQLHRGPIDLGEPMKAILSPEGTDDPRPALDVVYALKHEGVQNLPTPISVLLMFVMTALFMGTLMSCLDISTERPIYIRERMANQRIADYLLSKLPFLLMVTAIQCAVFLGVCELKEGFRECNPFGAYLALVAMAWTACAMGLFLSAIDPTAGQFSVIMAIVALLPQLVFCGGLAPDFYLGMPDVMKGFANVFPARWGLEMLMTAFYDLPQHASLAWTADFVPDTVGFRFGTPVYLINVGVLLAQVAGWLILCAVALKRLERAR